MHAIAVELRARGAIRADQLEAAVALQSLHGGHLLTSLYELGWPEDELQDLLAVTIGLPAGPRGRLPEPETSLWSMLSPAMTRRFRVFPVENTTQGLVVATASTIAPASERSMADAMKVALHPVVVTPLRLREALYRFCGERFSDRERWLLAIVAAGKPLGEGVRDAHLRQHAEQTQQHAASYRRMSEHPEGIVRSGRQPDPKLPDPEELVAMLSAPIPPSVEAVSEAKPETRPYDLRSSVAPAESSEPPPLSDSISSMASDLGSDVPSRITQPYAEGEEPEGEEAEDEEGERRNTQPWRDDEEEEPVSVTGEFSASLAPDPSASPEDRHFRHRGPFTRRQAEIAASQAMDVNILLEILMRYAQQFFERCLLMAVFDRRVEVRYRHGVANEGDLALSLDEPGLLADAYASGDPIVRPLGEQGTDAQLRGFLGVEDTGEVAMIPLCIRERVVAMFYGDDGLENVHREAVDDVTDFTEVCAAEVPRLILARKRGE